jgi:hypothetical protein
MIEGALILFAGMIIGAAAALGAIFRLPKRAQKDGYEKYRNKDGLLSRKIARESDQS